MQVLFEKITLVFVLNFEKAEDEEYDSNYGSDDPEKHLVLLNPV